MTQVRQYLGIAFSMMAAAGLACGDDSGPPADASPADATSTDGPPTNSPAYAATALVGGLDRIVITKFDPESNNCHVLRLVHPAVQSPLSITAPADWSAESAYQASAASCSSSSEIPADADYVDGASGIVTWTILNGGVYPSILSVDVILSWDRPNGVVIEPLQATDLPLEQFTSSK